MRQADREVIVAEITKQMEIAIERAKHIAKLEFKDLANTIIKNRVAREMEGVKSELFKDMRQELFRFVEETGKDVVIDELRKVKPTDVMIQRFDELLQQNFKPITGEVVKHSIRQVADKIDKQLKNVINLKTSTIMGVKDEISNLKTSTEEESLQQLALEFPEYYKALEDKSDNQEIKI